MLGELGGLNFRPFIAARFTDVLFEVALFDSGAINFDPFCHGQIDLSQKKLHMMYRRRLGILRLIVEVCSAPGTAR